MLDGDQEVHDPNISTLLRNINIPGYLSKVFIVQQDRFDPGQIVFFGQSKDKVFYFLAPENLFTGEKKLLVRTDHIDTVLPNSLELRYKLVDRDRLIYPDGVVSPSDEVYRILNETYLPGHLTDIAFCIQPYENRTKDLVFVGRDSKNRLQYYYGSDYIKIRKQKATASVIEVNQNYRRLEDFLQIHLPPENKQANRLSIQEMFAVLLLLETRLYIRTGKKHYRTENGSMGLLTLEKKNITTKGSYVILSFIGKKQQHHQFSLEKKTYLGKMLLKLSKLSGTLLFSNPQGTITERFFYTQMKHFGFTLKNIRTFGVNKSLLQNWKNILIEKGYSQTAELKTKKEVTQVLKQAIEQTAHQIGHTPAVCKKNYLISEVLSFLSERVTEIDQSIDHISLQSILQHDV